MSSRASNAAREDIRVTVVILIAISLVLFMFWGRQKCRVRPMQEVFQFEKRSDSAETCEREEIDGRSNPSNESKNSKRLLILNCESSCAWFTRLETPLVVGFQRSEESRVG